MKRVLVLHAQVPFVRGGAELLVEGLVNAINDTLEGVTAELVQIPFKWYPEEQIISDMMAWRSLDLTSASGQPIDLVIGTKFPSYAVNHPNKVTWLVHQHRVFYDLEGTSYDRQILSESEITTRETVRKCDERVLRESKGLFTIANTVSDRLLLFNGLASEVVFPPSAIANGIYSGEYGEYIICVARVDRLKRQDLLVQAATYLKSDIKIKIVGNGDKEYTDELQSFIESNELVDRVELLGFVEDAVLLKLLANARAVYYGPFDEDYGYATIEGFLAKKPIITLSDSGEVARIVERFDGGWVSKPSAKHIASMIDEVTEMSDVELELKAQKGFEHAKEVTWENVLSKLVIPNL